MLRPYDFSLRLTPGTNDPFIEAVHYYGEMLRGLKSPHVYSGLKKLFALQSGGVDMTGVSITQTPFLTEPAFDLTRADSLAVACSADRYLGLLIASNTKSWVDALVAQIRRRLASYGQYGNSDVDYTPEYSDRTRAFSNFFVPSASAIRMMCDVSEVMNRPLPDSIRLHDIKNTVDQLNWQLAIDVDRQVKSDGRGSVEKIPSVEIYSFLSTLDTMLNPASGNACAFADTLLRITLNLTRLLYGQVYPISYDRDVRANASFMDDLRISDETLLCLPAPTKQIAKAFEEPEVSFVSRNGALYLSLLENVYTRS